jgi:hypothetical protein
MFTKQIYAGQYLTDELFKSFPEAWTALKQVVFDNRHNIEDDVIYDEQHGHININLNRFFSR